MNAATNPPHPEERPQDASRRRGGPFDERKSGKPDVRPSFETAAARPPQDEAEREREALTPLFRFAANMLALWGLCANLKCRRARACKGDACYCVARHAPLVPEDAREGVKAMIEGQRESLSFEDACARAWDNVEAMIEWQALVARAQRGACNGGRS